MKEGFETKRQPQISPNIEDSKKESSIFSGEKTQEEIRKLAPEYFTEKMKEKNMEKVHLCFALMNSRLPFEHDFIQEYMTHDTSYFSDKSFDFKNLELLEKVIKEFDFEKDGNKMFPTSMTHLN